MQNIKDKSNSIGGYIWQEILDQQKINYALSISQKKNIPEIIARILVARGVTEAEVEDFLDPKIKNTLPDPLTLKDMDRCGEILVNAILSKQKIAIFGDYDVDGVCSSSILSKFLENFAIEHEVYIPDRMYEGYGANETALTELINKGYKLIILVDCGSGNIDLLRDVQKLNDIKIIVLDHHQIIDDLPDDLVVVNPNRIDDFSGLGNLCAAGVVFMVLVHISRLLRNSTNTNLPNLLELLDLVALATICDVMTLVGLNRSFVVSGLKIMHKLHNKGIAALAKVARIGEPLNIYHCGFLLGPRINAGGRLRDAAQAVKLLTSNDKNIVEDIAEKLDKLNFQRQSIQNLMIEQALVELDCMENKDSQNSCVIYNESWHIGLIGLVASRLKDKLFLPTIVIAPKNDGSAVGSGRSIAGFDLGKVIKEAVNLKLLEKGGGHAMAAGLTIKPEKIAEFRNWFEEKAAKIIPNLKSNRLLKIDAALSASGANVNLVKMIEQAGPYGTGHPKPLFLFASHKLANIHVISNDHLILMIEDGFKKKLKIMAFNSLADDIKKFLLANEGSYLDFICNLSINNYQFKENVIGFLVDVRTAN
ncbi:single-stranded-DNA-specific exonuclease RecJ [Bartonella sp. DGB1]|uniref:single-stranded-DNA-specific exonuclease RecJ n=1 Tax=Bartonella sp. DGB1 TaxID=3239807 RepID=UPI0035235BE6